MEKNLLCEEISDFYTQQMWRNLKFFHILGFLHMTNVEKFICHLLQHYQINNVYHLWCFITKSVLLQFTMFCSKIWVLFCDWYAFSLRKIKPKIVEKQWQIWCMCLSANCKCMSSDQALSSKWSSFVHLVKSCSLCPSCYKLPCAQIIVFLLMCWGRCETNVSSSDRHTMVNKYRLSW